MAKIDFKKELRKVEELIRKNGIRTKETRQKVDELAVQIQKHYDEIKAIKKLDQKNKS